MYIGGNRVDGMHHRKKRTANSNYDDNNIIILKVCSAKNATIPLPSHTLLRCPPSLLFFLHMFLILILLLTHT